MCGALKHLGLARLLVLHDPSLHHRPGPDKRLPEVARRRRHPQPPDKHGGRVNRPLDPAAAAAPPGSEHHHLSFALLIFLLLGLLLAGFVSVSSRSAPGTPTTTNTTTSSHCRRH